MKSRWDRNNLLARILFCITKPECWRVVNDLSSKHHRQYVIFLATWETLFYPWLDVRYVPAEVTSDRLKVMADFLQVQLYGDG